MFITIASGDRPEIRVGKRMEEVKGSHFTISCGQGDSRVWVEVYDEAGDDSMLCCVPLTASMLRLALEILESNLGEQ